MLDTAYLLSSLGRAPRPREYRVAFSGGADSTALLHLLSRAAPDLAPARLSAVHVHHGLQAQADAWAEHCAAVCAALGVPLQILHVDAAPRPGRGPEASARDARYAAIAELLDAGDVVLAAHHRDDQVETLLLNLQRGSGPLGLAGMRELRPLGRGWLLRPLLEVERRQLHAYLESNGLTWIDDPSNRQTHYDRNHVRTVLLPAMRARRSGVDAALARAARLQGEAALLIGQLAEIDAGGVLGADGTLDVDALHDLPVERRRSLLRHWLDRRQVAPPNAARVQAILDTVCSAAADARPAVAWPGGEVRRYRGRLYALRALPAAALEPFTWDLHHPVDLPHGRLSAALVTGAGLACAGAQVEVRFRQGGERYRSADGGRHQTLKNLFQGLGVPPWLRDRLPLLYIDGKLAAVSGHWSSPAFRATGRAPGWRVDWRARP